ncbi:MAG: 4Fe-4S dicluster domain-containing protein [Nitrospiraceae bacterium]|nr:4Fe-4S dicluster domain-containing protein [Nitrospiraceae bacterium]
MYIKIEPDLCSGCLSCIAACSLSHEGYVSPSSARLQVNIDLFGKNQINFCRQCSNAPCANACPVGAITRLSKDEPWLVNYEKCISCKACIQACPFNAMLWDPIQKRVIKCDLCAGEVPACVDACPTGALSLETTELEAIEEGKAEGEKG